MQLIIALMTMAAMPVWLGSQVHASANSTMTPTPTPLPTHYNPIPPCTGKLCFEPQCMPANWHAGTGSYSYPTAPTSENAQLLQRALSNESDYNSKVKQRVCVSEIFCVQKQVVAGYNYRYHVSGAPRRKDNDVWCTKHVMPKVKHNYTIVVWDKFGLNGVEVSSIEKE